MGRSYPLLSKHPKAPWTRTPTGRRILHQNASGSILERPKGRFIARVSERRAERERPYRDFARTVVKESRRDYKRCPVVTSIPELRDGKKYGAPISSKITDCHHIFGRGPQGELLCWRPGCMGVSRQGHRWIDAHKDEARKRGWLAPKGLYNNPKKVLDLYNETKNIKSNQFTDRRSDADLCDFSQAACWQNIHRSGHG